MRLKKIVSESMDENCYIAIDENSLEGVIFDPGENGEKIIDFIKNEKLNIKAILLTHGHFDHIGACGEIKKRLNVPIIVHENEKEVLESKGYNLSARFMEAMAFSPDECLKDGDEYSVGELNIKVIHTPGHTPGGCCYYFTKEKILISGDTLFQCSVGRTDFPGGNSEELLESLKRLLTELDDDVRVMPGHGGETTIGFEKKHNPYARM